MATRPSHFEGTPENIPPPEVVSSGSMGSQLNKYVGKDTRITPDRKWALKLNELIPVSLLGKATDFIGLAAPEYRQERAQKLLAVIESKPQGILRAVDQEIALQDCIAQVKEEERNEPPFVH